MKERNDYKKKMKEKKKNGKRRQFFLTFSHFHFFKEMTLSPLMSKLNSFLQHKRKEEMNIVSKKKNSKEEKKKHGKK